MDSKRLMRWTIGILATIALIWFFYLLLEPYFGEFALSVSTGIAMLVLLPVVNHFIKKDRISGVFYKINSTRGLSLMNRLGKKYSRFWIGVGNLAIVLLFGGIGSAFVTAHLKRGQKRKFVYALLLVGTLIYAYFFFGTPYVSLITLPIAFLALVRWSPEKRLPIFALIASALIFASPFIYAALASGESLPLAYALFIGLFGAPAFLIMQFLVWGIAFSAGIIETSAIYPALPAVENGVPVLKDPGGFGISMRIVPDLLFAFVLLLVLHEGFHGLVARAQGIKLRNTGIMTLSILPLGAFVEPDEEQFKKDSPIKRARVFVVGSFANIFVLGVISFALGALMVYGGFIQADGIQASEITVNSTAYEFIELGDVVHSIDGIPLSTATDFQTVMSLKVPGQVVDVVTEKGAYTVALGEHPRAPGRGYLGVAPTCDGTMSIFSADLACSHLTGNALSLFMFQFLKLLFLVNILVGIFNLLPIPILDGHGVYKAMADWLGGRLGKAFISGLVFIIGVAIYLNVAPYMVESLFELVVFFIALVAFIIISARFKQKKK
jgi:hypothetical protein